MVAVRRRTVNVPGQALVGDRAAAYNRPGILAAMTPHRLLTPADYRRMPWKNGGGRTTEIAAHPAGAGLDAFAWRVSLAEVARDGPFSAFPGVERTLVLLDGAGMRLAGDGVAVDLCARYEPFAFAGEVALACTLVDGPVRDFNLMIRRGAARGELGVVRDEAYVLPPARHRLCYVVTGTCECLVAGYPPMGLAQDCALLLDGSDGHALHVNPRTVDAVAIVVAVDIDE
jgi:environmental stress-induced protein Ves